MTLDERLEYIATLQQTHDEQIGRLMERTDRTEKLLTEHMTASTKRMDVLAERTIQAMDAIDALENPPR